MAMQAVFLLWFALLMHITTPAATRTFSGSERDRIALLAIKSEIKHDPQGVMSSWNESLHYCEWEGVTCGRRHRRVTILDLQSKGLVGSLSPYIGNLSFLMAMGLGSNTLQGKIPPEIGRLSRLQILSLENISLEGEFPANLSLCFNLISINLERNKLVGKIPSMELASLSKLKKLGIGYNNLTGGIPPSIGNLTSLEMLSASDNILGGSIPDTLGRLKNLKALEIGNNELSGTIPPSIYNLSSITILTLAINQLHGSLPPNIGLTLTYLQILQIFENNFSGSIPTSLSNASELQWIEVAQNNFTGKLSINFRDLQHLSSIDFGGNNLGSGEADEMSFLTSLANCTSLNILGLQNNNFGGALPNFVNFSTQLNVLDITSNQISGGFPTWIGTLVNLTFLALQYNLFTGTIPDEIGKLQKLQRLYLSTNRFSGKIPSSLGNLSMLALLELHHNKLQGTIPSSLGNCQNLNSLDLSHNNLSGTIPKQIFDVVALSVSLNLAQNYLVGSLPVEIGNLERLSKLDVSENKLFGEIPSSLSRCTSLEYLYMAGNFFQGSIPPSLSSLRGVQNLDLSRNNLSGQIPSFLETFSLKDLNLSFNNFEGEIPMKGIFTNASAISVFGNKKLCGGVPKLQLPRCTSRELKRTKMSFVLKLISSIVGVLVGVSVVSSLLFCYLKGKRKDQSLGSFLRECFLNVSYGRLFKATDGFSSANLIGVGSFGSVYKGMFDWDGTVVVAVKVLNLQRRGASKSFMAECEALRNIRHRNLVKIITCCSSIDFQGNDFKALVYEFMPNGSLERWLHPVLEADVFQDEVQNLNLLQRTDIAIDIACALDYLHHQCQNPIVHCDLKPSNILLDSDMTAHVGDFGLAKFLPELTNPNQSSSLGITGTIGYAAPEYGLGSEVSTSGDVYSYGILLLEMMTGKRPTDGMFVEGLNLHNFARMASPDRVMEIIDPILLNDHEEAAFTNNQRPRHAGNGNRIVECLISMVKIGVACSTESPHDRMDISKVVHELHLVKDIIQGTGTGPN